MAIGGNPRLKALVFALLLLALPGVAVAQAPIGCPATQPPALDTTPPINIDLVKQQLIYYRCTAYDADLGKVVAEAKAWVAERAPQVDRPAIVLDIDETSLSNWAQLFHNKFAYIVGGDCDLKSSEACGQRAWELSAKAVAIEPTLALFNFAKTLKGRDGNALAVFFVTGRGDDPVERAATELNLHKAGYADWRKLVLRPAHPSDELVSVYKTKARQDIEGEGFTVIANMGDQLSDLVGSDRVDRCYKLPNPFYFIAGEPVPEGGLACQKR